MSASWARLAEYEDWLGGYEDRRVRACTGARRADYGEPRREERRRARRKGARA